MHVGLNLDYVAVFDTVMSPDINLIVGNYEVGCFPAWLVLQSAGLRRIFEENNCVLIDFPPN